MGRLNQERKVNLEPTRLSYAKNAIQNIGYEILFESQTELHFMFGDEKIVLFPYSGWHTGKSIKDGRGIKNLLNQINGFHKL